MKRLPFLLTVLLTLGLGPAFAQAPTPGLGTGQIKDGAVQRHNLNTTKSGQAVITKIVAGPGVSLTSSGVDAGTGDVTISASGTGVSSVNTRTGAVTLLGSDLPGFGPSGSSHAPGAVPDPGSAAGTTRFLREDGAWGIPSGAGASGTGTVTSVGLTMDGVLYGSTVGGSPVTSSGTLTPMLLMQPPNTLLAGPASGSAQTPTFRPLVPADLPSVGTAGTYGDASHYPVVTVDSYGRVTGVMTQAGGAGSTGPAGPQGPTGPQGPAGTNGTNGTNGVSPTLPPPGFQITIPGALTAGADTLEVIIPSSYTGRALTRISAVLGTAGTTATTFTAQLDTGTGAFVAAQTSDTVSVAANVNQPAPVTAFTSGLTASGENRVRLNITQAGTGAKDLEVKLEF